MLQVKDLCTALVKIIDQIENYIVQSKITVFRKQSTHYKILYFVCIL